MHTTTTTRPELTTGLPSAPAGEKIPGKVLIIEDDEDLASLLQYSLKKEIGEVLIAENGLRGLELVESEHPDLILLDIMMPGLDGWEVCRRIRAHDDPAVSLTQVIMLTALGDDEDKFRGLEIGADLFVRKPYSLKEVTLLCRNYVSKHRGREKPRQGLPAAEPWAGNGLYQLLFHELRTQVVVIGSLSQRLCNSDAISSGKERIYAETIRKSSHYLEKLSDDVGLLECISNRKCRLPDESFAVRALIEEVSELLAPLMEKKRISLTCRFEPPGLSLTTNRKALQVIVSTFLENSIKYCLHDSTVDINGAVSEGRVVLRFRDDGPGIAKEEQSEIFKKYFRGKMLQSREPGTGLGLYFARSLTEALGGEIAVESEPGHGATFHLTFPAGS
jgi:two-component system, sensor histidine kinase and response regulator